MFTAPRQLKTSAGVNGKTPAPRRTRLRFYRQYERIRKRLAPVSDSAWAFNRLPDPALPRQGWKLHLSATILTAAEVLQRVECVLRELETCFKCARDLDVLFQLNTGVNYSQTGKFLTIYPRDTEQTVSLARQLHECTRGLRGPEIPFDRRYRQSGIVYYRYGSFAENRRTGRSVSLIDPDGKAHPDRRDVPVPSWVHDPFRRTTASPASTGLVLRNYVVCRALSQRGKGGVYEAIDFGGSAARLCIIKEGRRYGEVHWDASDGASRLRRETAVLRALRRRGIQVPEVYDAFGSNGAWYVVMEKLNGPLLLSPRKPHVKRPSWRRAQRLFAMVAELIDAIHAAGWTWRDCKPGNLMWDKGRLCPIDFEGACRQSDVDVPAWSTLHYTPPSIYGSLDRPSGVFEDTYALGVIAFQFGTGQIPPQSERGRRDLLRRTACPVEFGEQLLRLFRD